MNKDKQAHQIALRRRNKANYRFPPITWDLIESLNRMDWSPEQISVNSPNLIQFDIDLESK